MEPVIRAVGVSRSYGVVPAVVDVSLDVSPGELVAITGPSGSGKSTLLGLLAGLDTPSAGEIWLAGERVSRMDDTARATLRRRAVGFVFQTFNLVPVLTLEENVALPQVLDGVPERVWRPRVQAALAQVDLTHRAAHLPAAASVGEQQRTAIARVLAADPKVVFADEPTGSLDSARGDDVLRLLRAACERGAAVVLVTHDTTAASRADRVLRMKDGRLV
jgi:putative ABC transport system ATP-binding protein